MIALNKTKREAVRAHGSTGACVVGLQDPRASAVLAHGSDGKRHRSLQIKFDNSPI